ncbi:MAG: DoxX family protein [Acidimicrobiaceae bacterium]|nr:DoxX family protein [Acidimicrobiia bacterium]MCY4493059.1 DoxX family protein [Acidimicrobiaceae bacterium]
MLGAVNHIADADAVSLGTLIVRVAVGLTLAAHGYGKFFRGGKIKGTAGWFDSMGMRPGKFHALLAASTEVGAGLLFAAGLLTPLAALAFVALMVVAGWTAHRDNGFFIVAGGWEYNFVLAIIAVGVATTGPGQYSLDYELELIESLDGATGLLISAVGGIAAAIAQLAIFYRPPAKE